MRPGAVRRSQRALEKFVKTPQGAAWAADRGSEAQMQAQQIAAAQAAAGAGTTWKTVIDPNTGRPFAMVNDRGQSINLPAMKADEEIIFVDTQQPDPLGIGMVTVREPRIYNRSTRQMQAIPMGGGPVAGAPAAGGETGGAGADLAKPNGFGKFLKRFQPK
jgi:5-formyltetrahydrofolate cyclo-ligase